MLHPHGQSQVGMGRQGSMLTSPGAGSWPLPFPRASLMSSAGSMAVSASASWCLAMGSQLVKRSGSHLGSELGVPWRGSRVGLVLL